MSSSLVTLKTRCVEEVMYVKSVGLKRPPVRVMWKLDEGVPVQMSFSSLDLVSKLRSCKCSYRLPRSTVVVSASIIIDKTKYGRNESLTIPGGTLGASFISRGMTPSAAWRDEGIPPNRVCCRRNGIQDGGLVVSNRQKESFKKLL
ncbi:hypothetical protein TNCV_309131 [Trichonephila clavipes]|nr:hypothetical protein TNCV_309131 [Trichonephila clavipes]